MKAYSGHPVGLRQQGLNLVEIMIALFVGLLLIAAITSIFLASIKSYRLTEDLSRLQEDGRFFMEIIQTRARSAGYAGCYQNIAQGVENRLNNQTDFAWSLTNPIQGFNNVAANATIGGVASFIANTDVLVLKGIRNAVPLATNPDNASFTIAATNNSFNPGEILLVASCDQASLFQASAVTTIGATTTILHTAGGMTPGNSVAHVDNRYGTDAEIGRLQTSMFYLANGANGRTALFQRDLVVTGGVTAELASNELLPNVDNMQIVFGVDSDKDGDTDSYQDADAITDWGLVNSVQIALLLASEQGNQIPAGETYAFNAATFTYDKTVSGTDRRFRRIFTGYATLRNRTL